MEILTFLIVLGVSGFFVWERFFKEQKQEEDRTMLDRLEKLEGEKLSLTEQSTRLQIEIEKKSEELGKVQQELEKSKEDNATLAERGKQAFVQKTKVESDALHLQQRLDELNKKVTQFESMKEKQEKDFEQKVRHLEESRKSLEDEKHRIRREDEEKMAQVEAERNRVWAEHENTAIIKMKEICVKPELSFRFFENTELPENFDGKLKPDFLVEFLGQYIIFDAKMTKSEGRLNDYILDQVKSTAKKIEASTNKSEMYSTVFFIVPQESVHTLKKTTFYEAGYSFVIISLDAVEPILQAYKKITHYELTDSFDPQERENIVNVIATYDQHIHKQNAINILSSLEGVKVSQMAESLSSDMKEDIVNKKQKARIDTFKKSDLQKLIHNPEEQISEMKKMIVPENPKIEKEDLKSAVDQSSLF